MTSRRAVSGGRLRWLRTQIDLWVQQGVIGAAEAERIAAVYESPAEAGARRAGRLFVALCGLALLMFAVGVLLVIGYNWEALPRAGRVTIIFSIVAATFAASTIAYARARPVAGELLVFVATLFYGNAIWLLAQVYHIESHWPDGILWWGIGALLAAHLMPSRLCGFEAAALLTFWTLMESGFFSRQHYLYLPALALLIWLAIRITSTPLLVASLLGGALWITVMTGNALNAGEYVAPMAALAGCAIYAAGIGRPARWWPAPAVQACGIVVVLIALIPATFTEYHGLGRFLARGPLMTPLILAAGLPALFVATVFLRRNPGALRGSFAVPVVAVLCLVPLAGVAGAPFGERHDLILATLFSAASVLTGVWLILRGVRLERGWSFFGGVIYVLVFVLVRWMDLIGDMLTSSLVFFMASLVLLATAFFWRRRARAGGGSDA